MSVSRHPIALTLERQVGGATKLLATVMALPLVDGIFPALVIAGALTVPFGILETGLLIFGGSATVAVILAEMDGTPREQVQAVLVLGVILVPVAALEAALAPTIQSVLDLAIFERFAGLVILAVAAKTASAEIGKYLPRPAIIIGLGAVASVQPASAELVVALEPGLIARAAAAAGVGVLFALSVAVLGPRLRGAVDLDRFRFGSSVALGMLSLSVLGLMPTKAPVALGVLVVTAVFAYNPSGDDAAEGHAPDAPAATVTDGGEPDDQPASDRQNQGSAGLIDGDPALRVRNLVGGSSADAADPAVDAEEDEEDGRAPWL